VPEAADRDADLYRRVAEILGLPGGLGPQTALDGLAVDSFALVELVIEVQDRYGVRFDHADVRDLRTAGDLARLVRERSGDG
jgi:acyl carrier protein